MAEPFYSVDTLEPAKSIGFLLKRCGILMSQIAERRFASEPISFTQWLVLATLTRYEQLSATALSGETGHDMGALTRIVDDLEEKGLVRRERCERDRRAVEITLTSEGRRRVQSGKRVVVELLNLLAAPYSRAEIETLIGLLQRMLTHLQQAEIPESSRAAPVAELSRPRKVRRSRAGGAK
jgi:DNA-binding MarR family transcriptional regulator